MTNALELRDVSLRYGKITAVREVSMTVKEGSVVALLGPNGAGKTTLVKGIMGLVSRAEGEISLFGQRIDRMPAHKMVRMGVGFVAQGRELFPELSVYDNLMLGAITAHGRVNVNARLDVLFDYFPRLKDRRPQAAGSLSGGEQQMLAIARALISEPKVIILDEPSAGLAPQIVRQVFVTVEQVAREEKSSVLIAEQNAYQALRITDYAYVLDSGQIVAEGDRDRLMADDTIRSAYLGESGATRPAS